MSECPSCDKTFQTDSGMKSHHTQVHNESLCMIEVGCANCNELFSAHEYKIERSDNLFCSQECQSEYKKDNEYLHPPTYEGKEHPQFDSTKINCC